MHGVVVLELAQVAGQRAGVDADAQGRPPLAGERDDLGDLVGPTDVAGVDAHAVGAGFDRLQRERVVEVDVGDHRDRRLRDDRLERLDVLLAGHGDAYDVRAGVGDLQDLLHRRREVRGLGLGHRLHSDGRAAADGDGADVDLACGSHTAHCKGDDARAGNAQVKVAPTLLAVKASGEGEHTEVYATARGPLARVASLYAARTRRRRHERFFALTHLPEGARVLDVGCGRIGLRALEPALDITGVDLAPRQDYPGPFVQADAAEGLPFAKGSFDLVYCSSVIEHVPPPRREAFAAELRRVGRSWFVQTPAWSFPIEPHALLPAAHWLPPRLRHPYWRLGAAGKWEEIELLRRGELEALFGPAQAERLGPLVKSWVCVSPPGG